jgi:hypothetical protein
LVVLVFRSQFRTFANKNLIHFAGTAVTSYDCSWGGVATANRE